VLWLSFRQFRTQALVVVAAVAALAIAVVLVGSQLLADFHTGVSSCTGNCSAAENGFVDKYTSMGSWLNGLVLVLPGLIGVFWGAPLVARELESGTFRLAWTQSISRARWTFTKLVLLGLSGMAVAGLCSLMVTWWSSPLDFVVGAGPFAHYDTRGIVPAAYAAFAFAVGVGAGALIRRTVAAMGAALVAFTAVRVAFVEWVRPRLMAALTMRAPFTITSPRRVQVGSHVPPGAWIMNESVVNRAGEAVRGGATGFAVNPLTAVGPGGVNIPGVGSCPNIKPSGAQATTFQGASNLVARCVDQLHLSNVVRYQPANRYWPFQLYESLIFFALAITVAAFTVWWVRRLN
jgi:ABC-2 family transporter protein